MHLHSLTLLRFRQHAETHIDFRPGVTGIIGANGAGKSTILEAIAFALFGADAIRGTKGSIRWNRAPARKGAEVALEFSAGGTRYTVRRSEANASLSVADGEIAAGTSAVNAMLPDLLGMSYREFAATYLCAQKDLARLAAMGGTERQAFFRNVMGVGKVDEAVKAARDARTALKLERDGMAAGLGEREPLVEEEAAALSHLEDIRQAERSAAEALQKATAQMEKATVALGGSEERRAEHDRLSREVAAAEREVEESSAQVDRLTQRIGEAEAATERVKAASVDVDRLPTLRQERDGMVQARATVQETRTLVERLRGLEEEVRVAADFKADGEREAALYDAEAHAEVLERLNVAREGLRRLEGERMQRRAHAVALRERAKAECLRLTEAVEAIEALGSDGECPTCTRALGEHYETVRGSLLRELEDAQEAFRLADADARALGGATAEEGTLAREIERLQPEEQRHAQQAADSAQGARSAAQWAKTLEQKERELAGVREQIAALPEATFDPAALATVERLIAEVEATDRALQADRILAAQWDGLLRERAVWLQKSEAAVQSGGIAMHALLVLDFDADAHARIDFLAGEAQRTRDAAAVMHARAQEAVRAADDRLSRARRALAQYDERAESLADLTERLRVADTAAQRLADFRVSVASGIRPEMEELVSGFVSILTDGRYEAVTLTEDFDCQLYRGGVGLEVISGGEEDVAAVAMRLATSQMIAERAGHPLSLLILDEPFGSQDEARRDNMLALFRRLEGVFPQLLLISHVPEVQHACDHAVLVDFDEAAGRSRVRVLDDVAPCPF